MRSLALAVLAAWLGACSRCEPDLYVAGGRVAVCRDADAPWLHEPDLGERMDRLLLASTALWDADLAALDGWTIRFVEGAFECGGVAAVGCADGGGDREMTISSTQNGAYVPVRCVELTVIPHEVGHAVGHHRHEDDRFDRAGAAVLEALRAADRLPASCLAGAPRGLPERRDHLPR